MKTIRGKRTLIVTLCVFLGMSQNYSVFAEEDSNPSTQPETVEEVSEYVSDPEETVKPDDASETIINESGDFSEAEPLMEEAASEVSENSSEIQEHHNEKSVDDALNEIGESSNKITSDNVFGEDSETADKQETGLDEDKIHSEETIETDGGDAETSEHSIESEEQADPQNLEISETDDSELSENMNVIDESEEELTEEIEFENVDASYPFVVFDSETYNLTVDEGETANIKMQVYYGSYSYVKVLTTIYYGNYTSDAYIVATADETFYGTSSTVGANYTVTWDTTNHIKGTYTVQTRCQYYLSGSWLDTPNPYRSVQINVNSDHFGELTVDCLAESSANQVKMNTDYVTFWTKATSGRGNYNKLSVSESGILTVKVTKPVNSYGEYSYVESVVYREGQANLPLYDYDTFRERTDMLDYYTFNICVTPGTYYYVIKPGFSATSGLIDIQYSFSFTPYAYVEKEPNNNSAYATQIALNRMYKAYYSSGNNNDKDFFKFTLKKDRYYYVYLNNFAEIDASTIILSFTNSGGQSSYQITNALKDHGYAYLNAYGGDYTFEVENYSGSPIYYEFGVYEAGYIGVNSIKLNQSSASLTQGDSMTLTAAVSPANATNKTVTWKSSNTNVVTVSANGIVRTVNPGKAVITATADGISASCTIIVNSKTVDVTGVTLSQNQITITEGEDYLLTETVSPSNASNKIVRWASDNTGVATVNNGTVTALRAGTAVITATTASGGKTATCTVTVKKKIISLAGISFGEKNAKVTLGKKKTIVLIYDPADATDKTVRYTSSDGNIAVVDENGQITGKAEGTVTITVTSVDGNYSDTCSVTVTNEKNGLIQDEDGIWRLYKDNEINSLFTGLYPYGTSLFYLSEGVLDSSHEGIEYYQKAPYYVVNGQVTYRYTGLGEYKGSLHYFTNSVKDESFNGIAYYKGEPYFVVNGKVTYNYVGLGEYKGSLHYFTSSKKDVTYTGISYYQGQPYYVLNGVVSYKYNGLGMYKEDWWYVVNSMVDKSYTGSYTWKGTSYFIKNGKVS